MLRKIGQCLILALLIVLIADQVQGKILAKCDAVKELDKAKVPRSMISNWICLMQSESKMNTSLITGPKTASSYSYGIFQINSLKYCSRGHSGGLCNKRCEDFANDDIQDDIQCAVKIMNVDGLKAWSGWMKDCKNKPLPSYADCKLQSLVNKLEEPRESV
ncbi:lysozyme c-1-like [Ceratina calcarata]|uniref:lysozyme n=1 Tax=Ceratina calcarata TaxID=156304 RepID=A0AAJ7NG28_9HYME|nr:lysozyme c-1-like [Ceratina calcarata]